MLIVFLLLALIAGAATGVLLWGYGILVALLSASIAASGTVFVAAMVAYKLSTNAETDRSRTGGLIEWLSRRGNR